MALNEAQQYRELVYGFNSTGELQRIDPAALSGGQYIRLVNMVSWQEGAIRSRNGYENMTPGGIAGESATIDHIHSIARLATDDPAADKNYIYVGTGEYVYRLTSEDPPVVVPSPEVGLQYCAALGNPGSTTARWTGLAYRKTSSGKPYLYLASSGRMYKDPLDDNQSEAFAHMVRWGIDPPVWPARATLGGAGNLISLFLPYSYIYTLRNPVTGVEGNPCPLMLESLQITTDAAGSQISVTVRPNSPSDTNVNDIDPQVTGFRNIVLYRAGGSFSDSLYRRVAVLTGLDGITDTTFIDDVPDADIASNPTADFDSHRPVTASLPTPFHGTINSYTIQEAQIPIVGQVEVTVDVEEGLLPDGDFWHTLFPGTVVRVGSGTDHEEWCVVSYITGLTPPYRFVTVFQVAHDPGETIETASRANVPCRFAAHAFNSVFLAGDAFNPETLYKSKTGRPEAFPAVKNEADNSPGSILVGTPSNPIMNITEFGGYLLCLNKSKIYAVSVYNGAMQEPVETAAQRGLFASWAWCKADNELYYLAYDGIYSFSGGQSIKKSEQIDHIFKGEYSSGFYPISLSATPDGTGFSDLDKINLWYLKNEVFVSYVDTAGTRRRIRYSMLYDRWSTEDIYADAVMLEPDTGELLFTDVDSGIALLNRDNTPVSPTIPHTTDAWSAATHDDGDAISWEAWLGWMFMGQPAMQKQFGDLVLELANPDNPVTVEVYYDFATVATETFTVAAAPTRGRYRIPLPLNCGMGYEAYAISVRLTGTSSQPTHLYTLTFHYLTLEEIQRGRASDWDNLGYYHDKRLTQLSIEHDVVGTDVTLNLDIMYGISGNTQALSVDTFTLSNSAWSSSTGPLRARPTFPINLTTPVKLVRLRPTVTTHDFKNWAYHFEFTQYPPDKVLFTEWDNLGYACEKVLRELIIEIDTGDVECTVNVQADGVTRRTLKVKTTIDSRNLILTLNQPGDEEIIGRQFRLLLAPGTGGKSQLFTHQFTAVREPCTNTFWDSLEQSFQSAGWKFIKQMWVQYRSCGPVVLRVYVEGGELLFEEELTKHERRETERVYLPDASADGVLNKSRVYRFTLEALDPCCGFYLYSDQTRVEWMPVGADMRQAYQSFPLLQPMERPVMP
jgi:hypothetical protein